ncbi:CRISPR-associated protein Csm4 [Neisseria sp. HSC-16F19]|nr:hypothetical protein [Neisseria sp. HSC-16F19]MCP2041866.1 CRISPR-associated protein Csm4 [Neisseria sp. HSC-16F19]
MHAYQLTLRPETAFGTPLVGDTLFGHICWGIAEHYGSDTLAQCLQGYTGGQPFLVVGDAAPAGHLPLPQLPGRYWLNPGHTDRKQLKKRHWLPESVLHLPSRQWQQHARSDDEVQARLIVRHSQPHNSLNRQTHTTGSGGQFAPHQSEQIWYAPGSWQIYMLLDENRLSLERLHTVLQHIGLCGYGRDAGTGLGKFSLLALAPTDLFERHAQGNAVWTLAPSCPQGLGYAARHSYYQTQTRFGRHGNLAARSGRPFKQPILMAQSGAVFSGTPPGQSWVGQGIGGVSASLAATVHQGYAPALWWTLDTAALDD